MTEDTRSAVENAKRVAELGAPRAHRALAEVARKVRSDDDLRDVLARSYDMGFIANDDGSVDFPDRLALGDLVVDYIIDTTAVRGQGAAGAAADGADDVVEGDDAIIFDAERDADSGVTLSNVRPLDPSQDWYYRWADWHGNAIQRFAQRMPMTTSISNRSGVRLVGFSRVNCMARTEYWRQIDFTIGEWRWSPWRRGGTTGVFDTTVTARRMQQDWR